MNNSIEELPTVATGLLTPQKINNNNCWQNNLLCCCATTLSIASFAITGWAIGAIYGGIKNNDTTSINIVGVTCTFFGIIVGFKYGSRIGDYFYKSLINKNNNDHQSKKISSNRQILQAVTSINDDDMKLWNDEPVLTASYTNNNATFYEVKAEIHQQPVGLTDQPSTSSGIYHL